MSKEANVGSVPSREECLALMTAHGMLPHIREHSLLVAEVACWLGTSLREAGVPLRLDLVEAGALLHDLGKSLCLGTDRNHAVLGAKLLKAAGFPEVAGIVAEHIALSRDPQELLGIREAEVVNYADKRVLHTRVVPLSVRFADLLHRYGKSPETRRRILHLEAKAQLLEAKLFAPLKLRPEDLLFLNQAAFPWRGQPNPHLAPGRKSSGP